MEQPLFKNVRTIIFIILALALTLSFCMANVNFYAANLELVTDETKGIVIDMDGDMFFDIRNAQPGDPPETAEAVIKNTSQTGMIMEIALKIGDILPSGENGADVSKVACFTIQQDGNVIYTGTLRDAENTDYFPLGRLNPGNKTTCIFTLYFPGKNIGNEYQEADIKFNIYFYSGPVVPETSKPEDPSASPDASPVPEDNGNNGGPSEPPAQIVKVSQNIGAESTVTITAEPAPLSPVQPEPAMPPQTDSDIIDQAPIDIPEPDIGELIEIIPDPGPASPVSPLKANPATGSQLGLVIYAPLVTLLLLGAAIAMFTYKKPNQ